jgi:hypothetical protein
MLLDNVILSMGVGFVGACRVCGLDAMGWIVDEHTARFFRRHKTLDQ